LLGGPAKSAHPYTDPARQPAAVRA
jgi:hypothetical protein